MPQKTEKEDLEEKIGELTEVVEDIEKDKTPNGEDEISNGEEDVEGVENRGELKALILTPYGKAKAIDVDNSDRFEQDGISYGVESPLRNDVRPSLLIYNEIDMEPIHHNKDTEGEDSDYSSSVMDDGYLERKMEQLGGVRSGQKDSWGFLHTLKKIFYNWDTWEMLIIVGFFVLLLLNIPWGTLFGAFG